MPSPHLHPCTKPWTRCTQLQNVLNEITRDSGRIGWRPSCAERAIRRCCWGIAQSGLPRNRCAHGWWETTGKSLGSPLRQSCDGYAVYSRRLAEIDGEIEKYATQLKAKMELRGGPGPAALQQLANRKPPVTSISGARPASTLCRQKDSEGQVAFGVTRIPGRQAGTKAAGRGGAADSKNGPQYGTLLRPGWGCVPTTRSAG